MIRELATAMPANGGVPPRDGRARQLRPELGSGAGGQHYHGLASACAPAFSRPAPSCPDYELLELLLFHSIDVKDTKPLAKALLAPSAASAA